MKKILGWTAVGLLSIGGLAACGSDDDKSPSTTKAPASSTATDDSTAATTAGTTGGGESSEGVEKFCADVQAFVDKAKAAKPEDLATLQADATKLATDSAALITANPAAQAEIQACAEKIAAALTPGG